MSYALSAALQEAVYGALSSDPALSALVGSAVFDQAPTGALPGTYVSLGEEVVRDASDLSCPGAVHEFVVTVATDVPGFKEAKAAAAAVSDALVGAQLTLARGRLVSLTFVSARAGRSRNDARRRIDLRFRARVDDSAPV